VEKISTKIIRADKAYSFYQVACLNLGLDIHRACGSGQYRNITFIIPFDASIMDFIMLIVMSATFQIKGADQEVGTFKKYP